MTEKTALAWTNLAAGRR